MHYINVFPSLLTYGTYLQRFDAVGSAAGRVSGCKKTEWWDAGVVMCPGEGADLCL